MADITDVESALVALIAAILYPNGISAPSLVSADVAVFAGWPMPAQLDSDLTAGKVNVSVYSHPGERNTTRYKPKWTPVSNPAPTITATLAGQHITIGGEMPSPFTVHNVMALVNGKDYVYSVLQSDTLTSVAQALAALIAADVPGTSATGAVITLPTSARIAAARVGGVGTSRRTVRTQARKIQVTVWAPTPDLRSKVAKAIDSEMAGSYAFITLGDGTKARMLYVSTNELDDRQKSKLYRRDLIYQAEYSTTQTQTRYQVVAPVLNVSLQISGSTSPAPTTTINA